jgi:hypothetical protein
MYIYRCLVYIKEEDPCLAGVTVEDEERQVRQQQAEILKVLI